jgi:hypothetical protein
MLQKEFKPMRVIFGLISMGMSSSFMVSETRGISIRMLSCSSATRTLDVFLVQTYSSRSSRIFFPNTSELTGLWKNGR